MKSKVSTRRLLIQLGILFIFAAGFFAAYIYIIKDHVSQTDKEAEFESDYPLIICGVAYTYAPRNDMVVRTSGKPATTITLIDATGLVDPTKVNLQSINYGDTLDIAQAKIVDASCTPKSHSDISLHDIVNTYSHKADPKNTVRLVKIVKDN